MGLRGVGSKQVQIPELYHLPPVRPAGRCCTRLGLSSFAGWDFVRGARENPAWNLGPEPGTQMGRVFAKP